MDHFIARMALLRLAGVAVMRCEGRVSAGFCDQPDSGSDSRNTYSGGAGDSDAGSHRDAAKQAVSLEDWSVRNVLIQWHFARRINKVLDNTHELGSRKDRCV